MIYEPLTISQEQPPAAMGCPTIKDQNPAASPLPPNIPFNWSDIKILQDIKMALHSQISPGVQIETTVIKELSQQPEVTIEPQVGISASVTKELSHQPEVTIEPQVIHAASVTKELFQQPGIPGSNSRHSHQEVVSAT